MCRKFPGKLVFISLLLPLSFSAQTSTSSPYSRFGLGELNYANSGNSVGMSGLGFALRNDTTAPFHVNLSNPASLSSLRLTVFDISLSNTASSIQTSSEQLFTNRLSLGQMVFGVPMSRRNNWGMAFGLQPFSTSGYNVGSSEEVDSVGTVRYNYQGSGGINELFLSNGFRIKNLSAGITAGWLFGAVRSTYRDSFPSTGMYFNTRMIRSVQFNDVYFKAGLQYQLKLGGKWSAVLGAAASLPTTFIARTTTLAELLKFNSLIEIARDTALFEEDVKDTIQFPLAIGGGIILRKGERFLLGVDYFMQDWSQSVINGQQGKFTTGNRLSVGFQIIPDKYADGRSNFRRRIQYRGGFKYATHYLVLGNDVQLTEMSLTFGVGLPMRKMRAVDMYVQNILNLSVEVGQRGTTDNGLVQEQFVKLGIGFSLNEKWFIRRKYD
ncbi:MAG: hypothetical protein IT233_02255 [Bacteroidia bacterium]|nr:hypothetical protein [Bacteroidia bacterium]